MQHIYFIESGGDEAVYNYEFTCCSKTIEARPMFPQPQYRNGMFNFCPFCGEKLYGVSDPKGYLCHHEGDGFIYTGDLPTVKNWEAN